MFQAAVDVENEIEVCATNVEMGGSDTWKVEDGGDMWEGGMPGTEDG